eukprot:gene27412-4707_t
MWTDNLSRLLSSTCETFKPISANLSGLASGTSDSTHHIQASKSVNINQNQSQRVGERQQGLKSPSSSINANAPMGGRLNEWATGNPQPGGERQHRLKSPSSFINADEDRQSQQVVERHL